MSLFRIRSNFLNIIDDGHTYILKLNVRDEIMSSLWEFMHMKKIHSASFTGIGATEHAVIGYFDREKKEYIKKTIDTVCEITSLIGNLGWTENNEPIIHAHITLGFPDYHIEGGHLFEGVIGVVGEIMIIRNKIRLTRKKDERFGLMLIDIH